MKPLRVPGLLSAARGRPFASVRPLAPGQARRRWVALFWTLYGASIYAQWYLMYAVGSVAGSWGERWKAILVYDSVRTVFWILATWPILHLTRRLGAAARGVVSLALPHLLAASAFSIASAVFTRAGGGLLLGQSPVPGVRDVFGGGRFNAGIWHYAMVVAAAYALGYWLNFRAAEVRAARLRAQAATAEVRALNARIDSEFVLRSLRAFVHRTGEDGGAGADLIASLGDFLRYRTTAPDREHVPLRVELDGLRAYLGVERARTGRALEVEVDAGDGALEWPVPPMLLQGVGEALASAGNGARVTVSARENEDGRHLAVAFVGDGAGPMPETPTAAALGLPAHTVRENGTLLVALPPAPPRVEDVAAGRWELVGALP